MIQQHLKPVRTARLNKNLSESEVVLDNLPKEAGVSHPASLGILHNIYKYLTLFVYISDLTAHKRQRRD